MFCEGIKRGEAGNSLRNKCQQIASGWSLTNFVKGDKDALKARFLPETQIGRGTETQDITNTVAFLVSDVSDDIVGQVISVDGGSTIH